MFRKCFRCSEQEGVSVVTSVGDVIKIKTNDSYINSVVRNSLEYVQRHGQAHTKAILIVNSAVPTFHGDFHVTSTNECNYMIKRNQDLLEFILSVNENEFQIIHNNHRLEEMNRILTVLRRRFGVQKNIYENVSSVICRNEEILNSRRVKDSKKVIKQMITKNKLDVINI